MTHTIIAVLWILSWGGLMAFLLPRAWHLERARAQRKHPVRPRPYTAH